MAKIYRGNMNYYPLKYEKAKEMFLNGADIGDISKTLKMNRQTLRENFRLDGLDIPNHNFEKDRNREAFCTINTEEKAYWLGFLYADGYVNEKENRIELTIKDREHVEKFKKFINTQNKIAVKHVSGNDYYKLSFRDKEMVKDLIKKGCFQNKSLTLRYPTLKQVPIHLQKHFMRGYFDGDGCIYIDKNNKATISILGTKEFLNKMCKQFNLTKNTYQRCGKAYEWRSASQLNVYNFLDEIYKDSKIYLDRKYDLYLQIAVLNRNV